MAPSRRRCLAPIILGVAIIGPFGPATAQDIVYTPSNPSFGGNPFNSAHLLGVARSEEHTSELQSLMRISYAVFCLKKKKKTIHKQLSTYTTIYRHKTQKAI